MIWEVEGVRYHLTGNMRLYANDDLLDLFDPDAMFRPVDITGMCEDCIEGDRDFRMNFRHRVNRQHNYSVRVNRNVKNGLILTTNEPKSFEDACNMLNDAPSGLITIQWDGCSMVRVEHRLLARVPDCDKRIWIPDEEDFGFVKRRKQVAQYMAYDEYWDEHDKPREYLKRKPFEYRRDEIDLSRIKARKEFKEYRDGKKEARLAKEAEEKARLTKEAEEAKRQAEEAEKARRRAEEEARLAKEAEEAKRQAEEEARLAEEAKQRAEEEARLTEEKLEEKTEEKVEKKTGLTTLQDELQTLYDRLNVIRSEIQNINYPTDSKSIEQLETDLDNLKEKLNKLHKLSNDNHDIVGTAYESFLTITGRYKAILKKYSEKITVGSGPVESDNDSEYSAISSPESSDDEEDTERAEEPLIIQTKGPTLFTHDVEEKTVDHDVQRQLWEYWSDPDLQDTIYQYPDADHINLFKNYLTGFKKVNISNFELEQFKIFLDKYEQKGNGLRLKLRKHWTDFHNDEKIKQFIAENPNEDLDNMFKLYLKESLELEIPDEKVNEFIDSIDSSETDRFMELIPTQKNADESLTQLFRHWNVFKNRDEANMDKFKEYMYRNYKGKFDDGDFDRLEQTIETKNQKRDEKQDLKEKIAEIARLKYRAIEDYESAKPENVNEMFGIIDDYISKSNIMLSGEYVEALEHWNAIVKFPIREYLNGLREDMENEIKRRAEKEEQRRQIKGSIIKVEKEIQRLKSKNERDLLASLNSRIKDFDSEIKVLISFPNDLINEDKLEWEDTDPIQDLSRARERMHEYIEKIKGFQEGKIKKMLSA